MSSMEAIDIGQLKNHIIEMMKLNAPILQPGKRYLIECNGLDVIVESEHFQEKGCGEVLADFIAMEDGEAMFDMLGMMFALHLYSTHFPEQEI